MQTPLPVMLPARYCLAASPARPGAHRGQHGLEIGMLGNISMNTLSGLAVGILVGVAATLATRSHEAVGAGSEFVGAWRAVAAPAGNGAPVAWRINSVTGQMEMCMASAPSRCTLLPGPGLGQ